MKETKNFLYRSCAYTVSISMVFFLFARIVGISELSISFSKYLIIFAFSLVISASEHIFAIEKLSKILKYAIHYSVLCASFSIIFLSVKSSSSSSNFKASTVFASIVLFSLVYFSVIAVNVFVKKKTKSNYGKQTESSKKYTSRFKPD